MSFRLPGAISALMEWFRATEELSRAGARPVLDPPRIDPAPRPSGLFHGLSWKEIAELRKKAFARNARVCTRQVLRRRALAAEFTAVAEQYGIERHRRRGIALVRMRREWKSLRPLEAKAVGAAA